MGRVIETLQRAHRARRFHAADAALPARVCEPTGVVTAAPAALAHDGGPATTAVAIATALEPPVSPEPHPGARFLNLDERALAQYEKLFDRVQNEVDLARPQCVGITSARASEGTTTTVLNLAFAAVQAAPRRVLVVDANLGRPRVANRLGLPPGAGLSDILVNRLAPAEAIRWIPSVGYAALPTGRIIPGAGALLSSRRMGVLLLELKQTYDLVIVDAPHVRNHSVATMMSQFYDAVFVVVQMERTRRQAVDHTIRLLQGAGGRVCGCILTEPR